jgi:uncharacterized circularly permuted ATP-grasp superfamily protein/uncharacterized alpha-E superfamily protein
MSNITQSQSQSQSSERELKMFARYSGVPGIYDEMHEKAGFMKPHWRMFADSIHKLDSVEIGLRWEQAKRMIREHGVTYNVYGDPRGMDRPWELDMIPLIIPPSEWERVETGLIQRARLFNLILADLYGPQRLLREGILPSALIFANPNFLRVCHNIKVPKQTYLHLHATDLSRSPDGQWWVMSDRTQAPSGAGYTLENRIVLSRIFPDEFRDCQVQRLASFFRIHRDTLRELAPQNKENPSVVILTPGPYNETYFEHDYLARYLGFSLIEGGDLTVRDRRVYVKTLEGLRPVDVILRRVDDSFCDPLELRGDSFLGVAGLMEAVRAGNVAIANALGAGLVESPAFMAFLPSVCRHLLGEELKLPSIATWWCGQERERDFVLENLHRIVVKPAFATISREPFFGAKATEKSREDLKEAIRARPQDFVGQEYATLSTAPVFANDRLEPRPLVLRAYSTAAGHGAYAVMPGGLTRVSGAPNDPVVSMQSGGGSKDTWVLSDGPVIKVSLLSPTGQMFTKGPNSAELPSRVADNLYWLGRYAERLENIMRVLRCLVMRIADESNSEISAELTALVNMLVATKFLPARFEKSFTLKELEHEVLMLIYKEDRIHSAKQTLTKVRNIASVVRDRFSSDTWSILNKMTLDGKVRPRRIPLTDALGLLNSLIVDLSAFSGMEMENMTRGLGWRFLDLGRRLERASHIVNLFRGAVSARVKTNLVLEPVLEISDSLMTYRRRYFAGLQLPGVMELLLQDDGNPRALAFQINALKEHVSSLPMDDENHTTETEIKCVTNLLKFLEATKTSSEGIQPGETMRTDKELDAVLLDMQFDLGILSNQMTHHYFSHTVASVS